MMVHDIRFNKHDYDLQIGLGLGHGYKIELKINADLLPETIRYRGWRLACTNIGHSGYAADKMRSPKINAHTRYSRKKL